MDYFKDMRLIPVDKRQPLEEVLQLLLDYNAKGEKVYVDYGCVKFSSDDREILEDDLADIDRMYYVVYGMKKEQLMKHVIEVDFLNFGYENFYPELHEAWMYAVNERKMYKCDFNDLISIMRTLENDGIDAALQEYFRTPVKDSILNLVGNFCKKGPQFYRRVFEAEGKELTAAHKRHLKWIEDRFKQFEQAKSVRQPLHYLGSEKDLDIVIRDLQRAYNRGEYVSFEFEGQMVTNKEKPTPDRIYVQVYGVTKAQLEHNRRREEFLSSLDYRIENGRLYMDSSLHEAWDSWCRKYARDETRVGTEISLIVGTLAKLKRKHDNEMMRAIFDYIYQYKRNGYEQEYNTVLEQVNIFSEYGELFVKKMHEFELSVNKGTQLT